MSDTTGKLSREEANRRLLENVEAWKRFELESDVARWRNATPERRAAEVHAVLLAADQMSATAGVTYKSDPRRFPRLDRIRRKA